MCRHPASVNASFMASSLLLPRCCPRICRKRLPVVSDAAMLVAPRVSRLTRCNGRSIRRGKADSRRVLV